MTGLRTPIADNPTNEDLGRAIVEMHDCLDRLAKTVSDDRHASKNRDQHLVNDVAELKGSMKTLMGFFGLEVGPKPSGRIRQTVGGLEWWQAALGLIGALGSYKIIVALMAAFHTVLMTH